MTKLERELLAECQTIAAAHKIDLRDVLQDCHRFWATAGKAINPRGWVARAAAAGRLISRFDDVFPATV